MSNKYEDAFELANALLVWTSEQTQDCVIGQAALGDAWFRLCQGINYTPEVFREMLKGMDEIYTEQYSEGR